MTRGFFDVVGIGSNDIVLVHVKTWDWPRTVEIEQLRSFPARRIAADWFTAGVIGCEYRM